MRARALGEDEIGRLTEVFNEMLATIQQREAALRRAVEEESRAGWTLVEKFDNGRVRCW